MITTEDRQASKQTQETRLEMQTLFVLALRVISDTLSPTKWLLTLEKFAVFLKLT